MLNLLNHSTRADTMRHVRTRCQRKRNAMMCRNLQMSPNVRKRVRSLKNELVPSPAIIAKAQGGTVGQYVFFLKCVRAAKNIE
jgi:hypothetical protein